MGFVPFQNKQFCRLNIAIETLQDAQTGADDEVGIWLHKIKKPFATKADSLHIRKKIHKELVTVTLKISSLVFSTSVLLCCSVSAVALADGMPFVEPPPKQNLTPIDKSLTAPPAVTAPAPQAEAPPAPPPAPAPTPQAEAPLPPVPESRVVDVQPNTSFFGLSVGMYDPITHAGKSTAFNVEWQPGIKIAGTLQPLFGAMATTKGALLGYAGLGMPFNITDHVFLMPSLALGAYKDGADYNLGRSIVERAGAELAYQFDDKSRLGLNFDVLTNGESLHGVDRTEMVLVTYTIPLNALAGGASPPQAQEPVATPAASSSPPALAVPPTAAAPSASAPATPTPAAKPLPNELP